MADNLADLVVSLSTDFGDAARQTEDMTNKFKAMGSAAENTGKIIDSSLDAKLQSLLDTGMSLTEALNTLNAGMDKLPDPLAEAGTSAEKAAEQLGLFDESLQIPYLDEATGQLNLFTTELEPIPPALDQATSATEGFGLSAEEARAALESLLEGETEVESESESLKDVLKEAAESLLEFAGITLTLEALKEFVEECFELYAAVERVDIALTAMTGNASTAAENIENLKKTASDEALSFPQLLAADQRMVAFGFDIEKIPDALQAVADASAATGNGLDSLANSMERIVISGRAGARQLVMLGLSEKDLAAQMGITTQEVAKAFKELDQSKRLEVMIGALGKYKGVAADLAESLSGKWQKLKTDFEFFMESIGAILAPLASGVLTFVDTIVRGLGALSESLYNIVPAANVAKRAIEDSMAPVITSAGEAQKAFDDWINEQVKGVKTTGDVVKAEEQLRVAIEQGLLSKAEAAKMTNLLDEAYKRLSQNDVKKFISDLGVSIHVLGMLSSEGLAAVNDITDAHAKSTTELKAAKEAYDAISEAMRNHTTIAKTGIVPTQDMLTAAYKRVQAAQEALGQHMEMVTDKMKAIPWGKNGTDAEIFATQVRIATGEWNKFIESIAKSGANTPDQYFSRLAQDARLSARALEQMKEPATKVTEYLVQIGNGAEEAGKALKSIGADISPLTQTEDAFKTLGLTSSASLKKTADDAQKAYQLIRNSGMATPREIGDAWMKAAQAQNEADHAAGVVSDELYAQRKKNIEDALKAEQGAVDQEIADQKKLESEIQRTLQGTFNQVSGLIARDLLQWNKWGQDIKKIGQDVFAGIFKSALTAFFQPMLNEWTKSIASWLAKLLGFHAAKKVGDSADTASTAAATAEQHAAIVATNVADVTSNAAVAAATAYAAYAWNPPLAAAMAALAEAAVLGFLPEAAAEQGADLKGLPSLLMQTHPDEMVLPAEHAETIRSLQGLPDLIGDFSAMKPGSADPASIQGAAQALNISNAPPALTVSFAGANFYGTPDRRFMDAVGTEMVKLLRTAGTYNPKF